MHAAVALQGARVASVRLLAGDSTTTTVAGEAKTGEAKAETAIDLKKADPSPLTPEVKELAWSFGAFLVLLVLMRYVFYPKVRGTMDARQAHIDAGLAEAEKVKAAAQAEVAEYQAAIDQVRLEAQARIDAAAAQVEAERTAKMAEVNAGVAARKAEAAAEVEAAKAAVASRVAEAASDVVTSAAGHVLGQAPMGSTVTAAVQAAMSAGVSR